MLSLSIWFCSLIIRAFDQLIKTQNDYTMKKFILYILLSQLMFFACKKSEVDPLFPASANQRTTDIINKYKKILVGAEFGWKATYYPDGGTQGGYSFYLRFDDQGTVLMFSDLAYFSAADYFQTTYQVKAQQAPSLVFDTYSYLHLLVDPDPNVWGGETGKGFYADQELSIKSASADSVVLVGNVNKTQMLLTRMTREETVSVGNGQLYNILAGSYEYIYGSGKFLSIVFPKGESVDININMNNKIFSAYYVNNNFLNTITSAYSFTTQGIHFKSPVSILGYTFQDMYWDSVQQLYYLTVNGTRINLKQNTRPSLPFRLSIGTLFSGVNFDPTLATQDPVYTKMYNDIQSSIRALSTTPPTRELSRVGFYFGTDGTLMGLALRYTRSTSIFEGIIYYQITSDSRGYYTFQRLGTNGINGAVEQGAQPLINILENDTFTFDYDPTNGQLAILKSLNRAFSMKGIIE